MSNIVKNDFEHIQENIDFCNDFLIKRTQYNELLEKLSCSFFWLNDNKEGLDILYNFSKNKYIEHNSYFPEGFDNLSKLVIDYLYETGKDLTSLNVEDLELAKMLEYS